MSAYGKSFQATRHIENLLKAKKISGKRVIMFSKTYKHDPSQQQLIKMCSKNNPRFQETNCFEKIDLGLLQYIYKVQEKIKEAGKQPKHYLIYMDDVIGEAQLKGSDAEFTNFICTMRHMNMSLVCLMQSYKAAISPTIRNQMTHIAIGSMSNSQAHQILEDFTNIPNADKKKALQLMHEIYNKALAMEDNHGFLVIHTQNQWGDCRCQMGSLWSSQYADISQPYSKIPQSEHDANQGTSQ